MTPPIPSRRTVLAASLAGATMGGALAYPASAAAPPAIREPKGRIFKSLKFGLFAEDLPILEKFKILHDVGFDGVELDAPHGPDKEECLAAADATGLFIDGMVDDSHWQVRMSDPDDATRTRAVADLSEALRQCRRCRGSTVLLVPGHGQDGSPEQVNDRAEACIRQCLPLAAQLGVTIALENVWNRMFYDHDGPAGQSADQLAAFVDRFASPLVGVQFDIGNHQKYGPPAEWIRTLGKRIVKLDIKDWSAQAGFCEIGEGDVDWPAVRAALAEIGFHGWAAAEVEGGDRKRMQVISRQMDQVLALNG